MPSELYPRARSGRTRQVRRPTTGMALVMDFESAEAIEDLFASSEYAELLSARDRGFKEINILVTHEM